jgi:dTDP-D-glucose 4,6-dehydratase
VQTDPTLGEVMRRLEDVRQDLKDDFRELGVRLDSKVSMERYQLEQVARDAATALLVERVKTIEDAREQEEKDRREEAQRVADRRAHDRRLIFTAIIAPVLMLLLTVYLSTRGAAA